MQGFCLFLIIKNCFQSVKKLFPITKNCFQSIKKLFPVIKTVSDQKKITARYVCLLKYMSYICPLRYRIIPSAWKGIAPQYSPGGHCASLYSSVFFHCLQSVLGTGRNIGTPCTFERRQIFLIHPDWSDHCFFHHFHIITHTFRTCRSGSGSKCSASV